MRVTAEGFLFLSVETEDGERFALNAPIGLELDAGVVRLTGDAAAPLLVARSAVLDHGLRQALRRMLPNSLRSMVPDSRCAPGGPRDLPRTIPGASGLGGRRDGLAPGPRSVTG